MHPVDALIAPTTSRANQSLQETLIIALDDAMTGRAEESASIAAVPTSRALVIPYAAKSETSSNCWKLSVIIVFRSSA